MTRETAQFLLGLVEGLSLNVGASDFEEAYARVLAAKQELEAILADQVDQAGE